VQRRTRTIVIASAAAAVAVLAYFAPEPPSGRLTSAVTSASRRAAGSPPATGVAPAALPERTAIGRPLGEPFAVPSWGPSAPAGARAPQQTAVVPPVPYTYAGKLISAGKVQLFVAKGDRVFPVVKGETLDGAYRVESVAPDAITLLNVPLGRRERIPVVSTLDDHEPVSQAPEANGVPAPSASQPIDAPTAASSSERARLRWEGPERVRAGSSFDVALRVTSGEPLRASPMQLRFDASLLEPVTVRPGKFFGAEDQNFSYRVNPDGTIFVGVAGRGVGAAADAELLVMTFKPVKAGATAEVNVTSLELLGSGDRSIAFAPPDSFRTAITR
jgi:hypothetical protein